MAGAPRRTAEPGHWALRAEHVGLVLVLSTLVLMHAGDVAWGRFVVAFAVIDLVGYAPWALASRRARGGSIAPAYYHLYNLTHSYLVAGAGIALWAMAAGTLEWAMLAVPIHLSGDRGLLGNSFKSLSRPFDPRRPGRLPTEALR